MNRVKFIQLIFLLFQFGNLFSQGGYYTDEYKYWCFQIGLNQNFGTYYKQGDTDKFAEINGTNEKLISKNKYHTGYESGINLEWFFVNDFTKNPSYGLTYGLTFNRIPFVQTFYSEISDTKVIYQTVHNTFSLNFQFHFYKDYEKQRYFALGTSGIYSLGYRTKEVINKEVSKKVFYKNEWAYGFNLSFNYLKLNLSLNYIPECFKSDSYGNIYLTTAFRIPMNSWSSRSNPPPFWWLRKFFL